MRNIQLAQILALALSASNLPVRAFEPPKSNGPVRDTAKNKPHQGRKEMERRAQKQKTKATIAEVKGQP